MEVEAIAVDLIFQRVTRKNAKRAVNPRGVRRDKRLTVLGRRVIDVRTKVDERRPGRLIGVAKRVSARTDIVVESGAFRARAVVGELIVLLSALSEICCPSDGRTLSLNRPPITELPLSGTTLPLPSAYALLLR